MIHIFRCCYAVEQSAVIEKVGHPEGPGTAHEVCFFFLGHPYFRSDGASVFQTPKEARDPNFRLKNKVNTLKNILPLMFKRLIWQNWLISDKPLSI